MTPALPTCPTCRYPVRPAHILARAIRSACIALRDAASRLDAPTRQRDAMLALGDIERARALEAVEESCACPAPIVTCPVCLKGALRPQPEDGVGFYCPVCSRDRDVPPITGDGYIIAPATVPPSLEVSFPADEPPATIPGSLVGVDPDAETGAE